MEHVILKVNGMSCFHCVNAIKNALSEIAGIKEVQISLEEKTVAVKFDKTIATIEKIKEIIIEEGYEVIS